jgi:hypothetical protein
MTRTLLVIMVVTVVMTAVIVIRPFVVLFTRHPHPLPFIGTYTTKFCGFL